MRRLVAALLTALPFDARSRRALDETLLDWAHEEAGAASAVGRWSTAARAVVAVSRALTLATAREVVGVPHAWLFGRLVMFSATLAIAALVITYGSSLLRLTYPASPRIVLEFDVLLLPAAAAIFLPLAFFLAMAWPVRGQSMPPLGTAVLAIGATLAFSGWIEPAASHGYNQLSLSFLKAAGAIDPRVVRGVWVPEATLLDLARHGSLMPLIFKVGLAPLAGACVTLAAAMMRRKPPVTRAWLLLTPVLYLIAMQFLTAGFGVDTGGRYAFGILGPTFAPWSIAAVSIVVLLILQRETRGRRAWLLAPVFFLGAMKLVLPDDWLFLYRALGSAFAPWWMTVIAFIIAVRLARESAVAAGACPDVPAVSGV